MFKNIVILTGAGISAESGIQTFRGISGLWEEEKIEEVATPEAFRKNPKKVFDFYNRRKKQLLETGDEELIEGNRWHDNVFGSCFCPKCGDKGQNMLGKLLMELRDKLKK